MQQQNTVAWAESRSAKLSSNSSSNRFETLKTEAALTMAANVNNRRCLAEFLGSPQQNFGDVHADKTFENSAYFRMTDA